MDAGLWLLIHVGPLHACCTAVVDLHKRDKNRVLLAMETVISSINSKGAAVSYLFGALLHADLCFPF
jgi:hypothetical protein